MTSETAKTRPPGRRDEVRVELGPRSYSILIGEGLLAEAGAHLRGLMRRPKTAVITDDTVAELHVPTLTRALDEAGITHSQVIVPAGEASKSFAELERVCDALLSAGIERGDMVIALGGGVIGDLAGFAAAILRRGVAFAQIPTTLLAQVDSSVGGKTGINTARGKNLIGAFHQPSLVLADTGVLATLPDRQFRAGYAEMAKYGLIVDADFFAWLEANLEDVLAREPAVLAHAIARSCRTKAGIVAEDEREAGRRALLNLGHTFGHALEAACGYSGRLLHGEAVAIGMVMAFTLSEELGFCPTGTAARIARHLAVAGLPTRPGDIDGGAPAEGEVLAAMAQDKKALAGTPVLILARGIGEAFISAEVPAETIKSFIGRMLESK